MIDRRPIFTILSLLIAVVFAFGSRPILTDSINRQLTGESFNSADAVEDSGRMAVFSLIAGQFMCGGIGAAVGVVFASLGFGRRERWTAVRWCSLVLNLVAAGLVGFSIYSLVRSQHHQAANGQSDARMVNHENEPRK